MLFGRQLSYSSNTKSTVVRNLTVLLSTTDKINRIRNHFLDRWRYGYVVNLRETQQTSKLNINSVKTSFYWYCASLWYCPRQFWRIAIVTRVLPSRDSEIKRAIVRIAKTNTIPKHLVNKLFAIENKYHDTNQRYKARQQKFRLWTLQILNF